MRILVSNDDGIQAKGIDALVRAVSELGEVIVVAPDEQRSASSHGISIHRRLVPRELELWNGVKAVSLSGTPVDCIKFGIHEFGQSQPFDLVLSGINEGRNLATDVLYSGTVAAAGEAAMHGLPAVAVSLDGPPFPFEAAAAVVRRMIETLPLHRLPSDTFLSVNFPADRVDGKWVVTRIGAESYKDCFTRHTNDKGEVYYRYGGDVIQTTEDEDSDIRVVANGGVSITPLRYRFTNADAIDRLKTWL